MKRLNLAAPAGKGDKAGAKVTGAERSGPFRHHRSVLRPFLAPRLGVHNLQLRSVLHPFLR